MKPILGTLAVFSALSLAGCSSQTAAPAEDDTVHDITIGVVPVADVAPLYLGMEQGFFEEENLSLTLQNTQGAAAAVPLLLNGEMQLAFGAYNPIISVASTDIPVVVVSGGIDRPNTAEEDYSAIITAQDSDIKTLADLAGQKIAVNALRGGPHMSVLLALEAEGVEPDSVEFIELPMGEGISAVERGDVDAAYLAEPFTSQAVRSALPIISSPVYETFPEGDTSGYFTVQQYLSEHPEIIEAFTRALTKSAEYANNHPDEVREQISEYSGLNPEDVADMQLPTFAQNITPSNIETISDQLFEFGWIDKQPELASLVHE